MSEYKQKPGTGTAFKNDKYVKGGTQPYARGKVLDLEGNEMEIALWIPKSEKVNGFNVTLKEPYKKNSPAATEERGINDDGKLPF